MKICTDLYICKDHTSRQECASILTSDLLQIADEFVLPPHTDFKTTQYPQMCTLSTAMILIVFNRSSNAHHGPL